MTIDWECVSEGGDAHNPIWRAAVDGGWLYKSMLDFGEGTAESLCFVPVGTTFNPPVKVVDLKFDVPLPATAGVVDWGKYCEDHPEEVCSMTRKNIATIIRNMDVDGADAMGVSCRSFLYTLAEDFAEEMRLGDPRFRTGDFLVDCGFVE